MEVVEKCPLCDGKKEVTLKNGEHKGHHVRCWRCKGTGVIPKIEIISGRLFEAMIQDSVNLRQKLLWNEVHSDLICAGENQIICFKESIEAGLEEDYIIEEYKGHLKNFSEWFEVFKMDLLVVKLLRKGSYGFQTNNMIDSEKWIIK